MKNQLVNKNLKGSVKLIKEHSYLVRNGLETDKSITIFNDKGNVVEYTVLFVDGSLYKKVISHYDNKDNFILEQHRYDAFLNIESKTTIKNDDKGNMIERNVYNAVGKLISRVISKYDNDGNEIEVNWYNSDDKIVDNYTYDYNSNGNKIKETNASGNTDIFSYLYDNKDNIIEKNHYKPGGSLYEKYIYDYVYDFMGN